MCLHPTLIKLKRKDIFWYPCPNFIQSGQRTSKRGGPACWWTCRASYLLLCLVITTWRSSGRAEKKDVTADVKGDRKLAKNAENGYSSFYMSEVFNIFFNFSGNNAWFSWWKKKKIISIWFVALSNNVSPENGGRPCSGCIWAVYGLSVIKRKFKEKEQKSQFVAADCLHNECC